VVLLTLVSGCGAGEGFLRLKINHLFERFVSFSFMFHINDDTDGETHSPAITMAKKGTPSPTVNPIINLSR
jgi:hypothetical protein